MRNALLGLAVAVLCAIEAHAQPFPSKPIRLIVGFPPGGGTDNLARSIAPKAGEALGQPVVVENNGGASGMLATQQVQRSAPDGYTLLLMTTGGHLLRPMLEKDVPFDPIKDFTPVTQINISVIAIAANPATGPKSFEDLIDRARRNPGKLAYGTAGLGTETHFMMENIGHLINGPMQVVPYKGGGPAVNERLRADGHIPAASTPAVFAAELLRQRALFEQLLKEVNLKQ